MKKKASKIALIMSVIAALFIGTVSFAALQWSYIVECSNALREVSMGWFKKGANCYGTTVAEMGYDAGITVFLETLDEDGDWVTVTSWSDIDSEIAIVDVDYELSSGTYRLYVYHRAYEAGDHSLPIEMHYSYSEIVEL